jgi:adhesin transport system outer membrane protein
MALAKSNLIVTSANIENAKTDYQAVMGYMPGTLVKPAPLDKEVPANIQDAVRAAIANHPQLKSAKADIDARKFQHKTAKALTYPVIDVNAEYTWADDINGPINFYHYQDWFSVNAMMRFNIFNGWYDQARIKETAYLINEAEEIAKKTERQTVQSVRLAYEAFQADQKRITQLEQYVTSTGMAGEAFISQWSIGRRTLFDVLDTSAERITAKSDLINAQYDKLYDSMRILSSMGKLVAALGLTYPEESRVEYAGRIKEVKSKEEAKPAKVEEKVDGIWLREKK